MGFFGDLKADITQAVDELTDGSDGEGTRKENTKKGFGRKNKKNAAVKVTDINTSADNLYQAVDNGEDERSETEKALWDEIRADLSDDDNKENDSVLTSDDVVEEIEEIQETGEEEPEQSNVGTGYQGAAMVNAFHNTMNTARTVDFSIPEDELSDEVGVVTGSMTVLGNIYSTGHMEIFGNVEGDVEVNGSLRVCGSITGNVKASEIIIESGKIKGNVTCATAITVSEGSVIIGQLIAAGTGAVIAGAIKGDIDVHGPVTLEATAIVKGNIKSQSVQMANGAMVDGMCSQCYSEVDLSSYFDNMI